LESFAKFNSINIELAKRVAEKKEDVNESMKEFVDSMELMNMDF